MFNKIRIPERRIPVLIGKNGEIKKYIEKSTHTSITLDEEYEITISGDAVNVLTAENLVTAIGRGFSPERAMKLLDENFSLHIIDISSDRKILKRVKSRLIGTSGKCRRNLERLTDTDISIYGKTVSVIGTYETIELARMALEKLIAGSPHKLVYKFLEEHQLKRCLGGQEDG